MNVNPLKTGRPTIEEGEAALSSNHKRNVWLSKASGVAVRIKIGVGLALLAAFTGCVGYADRGYVGGGEVVVRAPEVYVVGGDGYDRGRDVHAYSQRGSASRAVAHSADHGHEARR